MKRGEVCIILASALLILVFCSNGSSQYSGDLHFGSIEFSSSVVNNYHLCSINITISNPHDDLIEAQLGINIPEDAMLTRMALEKDNRTYVSRIEKKAAAAQKYEAAVESNETYRGVGSG